MKKIEAKKMEIKIGSRFQPRDGNILVLKRKVSLEEDNKNNIKTIEERVYRITRCRKKR